MQLRLSSCKGGAGCRQCCVKVFKPFFGQVAKGAGLTNYTFMFYSFDDLHMTCQKLPQSQLPPVWQLLSWMIARNRRDNGHSCSGKVIAINLCCIKPTRFGEIFHKLGFEIASEIVAGLLRLRWIPSWLWKVLEIHCIGLLMNVRKNIVECAYANTQTIVINQQCNLAVVCSPLQWQWWWV